MLALCELPAQRGQSGAGLLHLGLQREQPVFGSVTEAKAFPGQPDLFVLGANHVLQCLDLRREPRPCNGCGGDVSSQRQMRAIQFVAPIFGPGGQRFQRTRVATGQVQPITHADAGVIEAEFPGIPCLAKTLGFLRWRCAIVLPSSTGYRVEPASACWSSCASRQVALAAAKDGLEANACSIKSSSSEESTFRHQRGSTSPPVSKRWESPCVVAADAVWAGSGPAL